MVSMPELLVDSELSRRLEAVSVPTRTPIGDRPGRHGSWIRRHRRRGTAASH